MSNLDYNHIYIMDATIFKSILESWWASLAVIVWWWYLIIKYFMKTMEAKDMTSQENLDRFIELIEKTNTTLNNISIVIDWKLKEIKEDIKYIKEKHNKQ